MKKLVKLTLFSAMLLLLGVVIVSCSSPAPSPYKDLLVLCRTVSDLFETTRESSNEKEATLRCAGGEWIEGEAGSYYEGERVRSIEFRMRITEFDSASEAQRDIDTIKSQVGRENAGDVVKLSNIPWRPSVKIDDFAEAEYRYWIGDTGNPSISYQLMARDGKVQFSVSSTDYAGYISRELFPVGNARWDDVERIIELLIERYQRARDAEQSG